VRGAFSMSEPGSGSDIVATAPGACDGEDFVLNGQEMWLTSGGTASLVAVPYQAGDGHDVPHRNIAAFLIEKETWLRREPSGPGLTVPGKIDKMGCKGVDTTELILSKRQFIGYPEFRHWTGTEVLPDVRPPDGMAAVQNEPVASAAFHDTSADYRRISRYVTALK
jgi:alkylation response protein AidB-like acyl-CoA dehydrogenase